MTHQVQKIKLNYEWALYGLLFLFPLFAINIRHWASGFFSLLILLGLFYFFVHFKNNSSVLHKYEKWYIGLLIVYFAVFSLSSAVNYPEKFSDTRFEQEIRFILIIPFYLLVRKYNDGLKYLAYGAALSIIISLGFCYHEIFIQKKTIFTGEYSQLFAGPVTVIYLAIATGYILSTQPKNYKPLAFNLILILISIFLIVSTQARVAYFSFVVLSFAFVVLYISGWKKYLIFFVLIMTIGAIYLSSESVKNRLDIAYQELTHYISSDDRADSDDTKIATSVGTRLEMLRTTRFVFSDYPVLGIGNGNYIKQMKSYVDKGLAHPAVLDHSHTHNVFTNALVNKGLLGLLSLILLFFYPLYFYIRTYKINRYTANIGIVYVVALFLVSLNDVAPFYKSNFIAINLVLSMLLFYNHMRFVKAKISSDNT